MSDSKPTQQEPDIGCNFTGERAALFLLAWELDLSAETMIAITKDLCRLEGREWIEDPALYFETEREARAFGDAKLNAALLHAWIEEPLPEPPDLTHLKAEPEPFFYQLDSRISDRVRAVLRFLKGRCRSVWRRPRSGGVIPQ